MSFTRSIPSARRSLTWAGRGRPAVRASRAGTRLSRIRVVLPEPDTPVTTVSRPLGMSTSRGFTVWMAPVERWIRPRSNRAAGSAGRRTCTAAFPERKGPDLGGGVLPQGRHRPLGHHPAAVGAGPGAHLYDPVRVGEDLGVVVHQQHRVPVRHQVIHDPGEAHDVGGVEADGGLVQHIEHPCGPVAHRPGPAASAAAPRWRGWRRPGPGTSSPGPAP